MKMDKKIKIAKFKYGIEKATEELTDQVIELTRGTGADGGVVGLSGGIDSTTVAYLCKYAFDKYNATHSEKTPLKLYGIMMPSQVNNPEDLKDALKISKKLGIESKIIEIEPMADEFISQIPEIKNEFDRGNLYSELRAVVLSRFAAAKNCRVMGTGNKDEDYVLGYCTKRGDVAVDNNILGNLSKRLVRELATSLGVSKDLVNRIPTAGLWKNQTDEEELGYNYEQAELIQNGFDQGYTTKQIQEITSFEKNTIEDVAKRHRITEHKRNVPPVGKVNLVYGDLK